MGGRAGGRKAALCDRTTAEPSISCISTRPGPPLLLPALPATPPPPVLIAQQVVVAASSTVPVQLVLQPLVSNSNSPSSVCVRAALIQHSFSLTIILSSPCTTPPLLERNDDIAVTSTYLAKSKSWHTYSR